MLITYADSKKDTVISNAQTKQLLMVNTNLSPEIHFTPCFLIKDVLDPLSFYSRWKQKKSNPPW